MESLLSFLYKCFEDKETGKEKEFWEFLRKAELRHIKNINDILDMLTKNVDFTQVLNFKPETIKAITAEIKETAENVISGKISSKNFYSIANKYEQNILESRYYELLISSDRKFTSLLTILMADTRAHQNMVYEYIHGDKKNV
jgi:hypothetical protein